VDPARTPVGTEPVDRAGTPVGTEPVDRAGTPGRRRPPRLVAVRLSEFWIRMEDHFGEGYARSVAHDHVLQALGGRTVDQALAGGEQAKRVWRAVCEEFEVPSRKR
jgi:Protein of unknown function (DUF3046)